MTFHAFFLLIVCLVVVVYRARKTYAEFNKMGFRHHVVARPKKENH